MQFVRHKVWVTAVVALNALVALRLLVIAGFADGGEWWERLPQLVHPVTAVLLILLMFVSSRGLAIAAVALILVNIAAYVAVAGAVVFDITKGDWYLPLIISIVPLLALPHAISMSTATEAHKAGASP